MKTGNPKSLQAIVVHGSGDKRESLLRGRATAVIIAMERTAEGVLEILNSPTDLTIVFSGSRTMGADNPSEAEIMYDAFVKRLRVLEAHLEKIWSPIRGWIAIPERLPEMKDWEIRIGARRIRIFLEDDSVDTEDNAEKTSAILEEIAETEGYEDIAIFPLSSDFHKKRVGQAFERNSKRGVFPLSAEVELIAVWAKYRKYGELERVRNAPAGDVAEMIKRIKRKISGKPLGARPLAGTKRVVMEICLSLASRTEVGREIIRSKTKKRVETR